MPAFFPSATVVTPGLAVSFDVENGKITAAASLQQACTSGAPFGWVFENILTGTVAADGSFTVATPPGSDEQFTISGAVPAIAAADWAGTYAFTTSSSSTSCPINLSGKFSAISVGDVTGSFTGAGPLTSINTSGAVVPTTHALEITATFEQRGDLATVAPTASPVYSDQALAGSIQISGISCFSKGQISATLESLVIGNQFEASYNMDDGSHLSLWGVIQDPATSKLAANFMVDSGGMCSGTYEFNGQPLVLSRQP